MNYRLTYNRCYYGETSCPFTLMAEVDDDRAGIPLTVSAASELDLEAIAQELNHTVFNRTSRRNRRGSAAKAWQLELKELTPSEAKKIEAELEGMGVELKGPVTPAITVIGNGVSLRWEATS